MVIKENVKEIDANDIVGLFVLSSPHHKRYMTSARFFTMIEYIVHHIDEDLGKAFDERSEYFFAEDPESIDVEPIIRRIITIYKSLSEVNPYLNENIFDFLFTANPEVEEFVLDSESCRNLIEILVGFKYDSKNFGMDSDDEEVTLYGDQFKDILKDCADNDSKLFMYNDGTLGFYKDNDKEKVILN